MGSFYARLVYGLPVLLCGALLFGQAADEPSPIKSLATKAAMARAARATEAAQETYRKAMIDIKSGQLAELKGALNAATKAGDLEEANAVKALIDTVAMEHAAFSKQVARIKVAANQDWQPAGTAGAGKYRIRAIGKWTANPATGMYTADGWGGREEGKLKCRIGERTFFLGVETILTVGTDDAGKLLEFRIHDGGLKDNRGELLVTVEPVASDPLMAD